MPEGVDDEQRKAATKRVRARFIQAKRDLEYREVVHTEIGALLEMMIDQEVRLENLEARLTPGDPPTLSGQ